MSIYDKTNKSVSDAVKNILESNPNNPEILKEYESKGGSYKHKGKYGSDYEKGETHDHSGDKAPSARGPMATNKTTTTTPGHSDVKARLLASQVKGKPVQGKSQSGSAESRKESVNHNKELVEMEQMIDSLIQEYESKGGSYKHKGKYGSDYKKGETHDRAGDKAPNARGPMATNKTTTTTPGHSDVKARLLASQVKGKPVQGKSQSGSADSKNESVEVSVKPSFSEIVSKYYNDGMPSLSESFALSEEPTNKEFQDEVKDQQEKFDGKKKGANVAAPSTIGTKEIKEEVEQIDEGKELTDAEMKAREKVVKGMKKNLSSFKARYGDRAKGVMYATATKMVNK